MQIQKLVTDAYSIGKAESVCRSLSQETCQLSGTGYIPESRVIDCAVFLNKMIDYLQKIGLLHLDYPSEVFLLLIGNHDKFLKNNRLSAVLTPLFRKRPCPVK